MRYEPISLYLAYFSMLRLVYYILVHDARWLLMLDVMKVVVYYMFYPITIVFQSGSSFVGLYIICEISWLFYIFYLVGCKMVLRRAFACVCIHTCRLTFIHTIK